MLAARILVVVGLTCFSGLLAGLTLGLMSLDETNLAVVIRSGTERQRSQAKRIEPIRKDGLYLLCTLLLASTIINETLPIVSDRIFGSGWQAILFSTLLVLVFAEIVPQSICSRNSLSIGASFVWLVKLLRWILFPIAYPTARLMERLLGPHQGIIYKRAELKELVAIMGSSKLELNEDEVTIIRGVLDLRDKSPANIMTPLEDVFMLEESAILDEAMLSNIVARGHSRIPVYRENRGYIVGMILAKRLITVDPKQAIKVGAIGLRQLPTTPISTSLFELLNMFQSGRSHIAIVMDQGSPIGIVTLEDIIEEIIQEEIIDETDEYIDMKMKILVPKRNGENATTTSLLHQELPRPARSRKSSSSSVNSRS